MLHKAGDAQKFAVAVLCSVLKVDMSLLDIPDARKC